MYLFWIIRGSFIGFLVIYDLIYIYFLKNRKKYQPILENFTSNLFLVILYNILCYVPVIIPPSSEIISNFIFSQNIVISIWFSALGIIFIIFALIIFIFSLKMRKVLGAQDTSGKLLTSGVYKFCRHPIYFSISLISLGFPLILYNIEGLLLIPLIILVNFLTGKIEEKYDMKIRFKEEYVIYKKTTKALGPWWFWLIIISSCLLPILIQII